MSPRSGAKGEGGQRGAGPHFGAEQCESDILPACARVSLHGCRVRGLLRNYAAIAGACFAGGSLNLWCQPSVRHTRQVSYAPFFLEASALLSRAVVFSICSVYSAVLPQSRSWRRPCPSLHATAHGKRVPLAGAMV